MENSSSRFVDYITAEDHADTYPMKNGTSMAGELSNNDVNSPAGGVSSTINDMARYVLLQVNEGSIDGKKVINAGALRETHKPQNIRNVTDSTLSAYALGWETYFRKGLTRVEHGGDLSNGVSTHIMFYPGEKMGIVVLTNGFPGGHILKKAITQGWDDLYFLPSAAKGSLQRSTSRCLINPGVMGRLSVSHRDFLVDVIPLTRDLA